MSPLILRLGAYLLAALFILGVLGSPLVSPNDVQSFHEAPPAVNGVSSHIFDPKYAQTELRRIVAKYADASRILKGVKFDPDQLVVIDDSETLLPRPGTKTQAASSQSDATAAAQHADTNLPPLDISPTGTAVLPLTDFVSSGMDLLYYGPLRFGAARQPLTVDIDTGSADLWIPVGCPDCENEQLDAYASDTYSDSGRRFAVSYGTGDVSGTVASDAVTLGSLRISKQAFGAVSEVSSEFNSYPNSGLLGLAFGAIAQSGQPTFFERLLEEKQLAAPLFSVHLTRNKESGGAVCFGCFDSSKATGPVSWLPVKSKTYWTVQMDGLATNSIAVSTSGLIAAIDTGTTLIYVPDRWASEFYNAMPGAKPAPRFGPEFFTYPCASTLTVALSFGRKQFALAMDDFNLGRTSAGSDECVGGILALGNGFPQDLAIVGDEFLKSWYSTFDYGSDGVARVGFSPSINNQGQ